MTHHEASESISVTRRRVLTVGGTAMLTSVGGCSSVVDFLGNQVLEDVNILNQINREVSGSITVIGPAGATVLDETFEVPSRDSDGDSNVLAYDDVWQDTGEYQLAVELTDIEIEETSAASETVSINDTDEEMAAVAVGTGEDDEPIAVRVGESLSDFGRTDGSEASRSQSN